MAKVKRKRRAKARLQPAPPALPAEAPRERADDTSVQDPLEDWPDEDEARWLRDRSAEDIEKPQD